MFSNRSKTFCHKHFCNSCFRQKKTMHIFISKNIIVLFHILFGFVLSFYERKYMEILHYSLVTYCFYYFLHPLPISGFDIDCTFASFTQSSSDYRVLKHSLKKIQLNLLLMKTKFYNLFASFMRNYIHHAIQITVQ